MTEASASSITARPPIPAGPILIIGLARSGIGIALALREKGLRVIGCDSGTVTDDDMDRLTSAGVEVQTQSDGVQALDDAAALVKSPGVPRDVSVVREALARGIPVMGELEIAWRMLPYRFIAVTGSNGKTTTVELLGHIFRTAGVPVVVAGNVGTPLSNLIGRLDPGTTIICEASSFQLEDTVAFAPEVAVLLNLTEDHLDRHGTFQAYGEAKYRVFAHQTKTDLAVVSDRLEYAGSARCVRFGSVAVADASGVADPRGTDLSPTSDRAIKVHDGNICWNGQPFIAVDELSLRGDHNIENALAGAAVALEAGLSPDTVAAGVRTFTGVSHRLEEVATVDGILYVNDSKATNIASANAALSSFKKGVHAILGGRGKDTDYRELSQLVKQRCASIYLIGEDAEAISDALRSTGIPAYKCGNLDAALALAREQAEPGDVVLLAPAAASYDQYRSFEERGEHFRELALHLGDANLQNGQSVNQTDSKFGSTGRLSSQSVEDSLNGP